MNQQTELWPGWNTIRMIGHGSFGTVYEIEREMMGEIEKAALKVVSIPQNAGDIDVLYNEGYDAEAVTATFQEYLRSIIEEYRLMRELNGCANVVNCDDFRYVQHDDGIGWDIFIKMELLTPLVKAIPAQMENEEVIKIGKDLCNALILCEKHNIIHRDIKPQNIFVSDNGTYKLGDFGVAKTIEKTSGGTKIGTYKYMAPEVYNNQPYGTAADIYSLGLVLYWLLNERRMPFLPLPPEKLSARMDEDARLRRLQGEALPAPVNGTEELKRIVLKACAYDVKGRYHTAEEMLADLERVNTPAPVLGTIEPTVLPDPPVISVQDQPKHAPTAISQIKPKVIGVGLIVLVLLGTISGGIIFKKKNTSMNMPQEIISTEGIIIDEKADSQTEDNTVSANPILNYAYAFSDDPSDESFYTAEEFAKVVKSENVSEMLPLGTKIKMRPQSMAIDDEFIEFELVAYKHFYLADSSDMAKTTWLAVNALDQMIPMKIKVENSGGWKKSEIRSWMNELLYPSLPDYWKELISCVQVISGAGNSSKNTVISKDFLFLPSKAEVDLHFANESTITSEYYSSEISSAAENMLFSEKMSRVKYHAGEKIDWWLRSATANSSDSYDLVTTDGTVYYDYAAFSYGVVPMFCI